MAWRSSGRPCGQTVRAVHLVSIVFLLADASAYVRKESGAGADSVYHPAESFTAIAAVDAGGEVLQQQQQQQQQQQRHLTRAARKGRRLPQEEGHSALSPDTFALTEERQIGHHEDVEQEEEQQDHAQKEAAKTVADVSIVDEEALWGEEPPPPTVVLQEAWNLSTVLSEERGRLPQGPQGEVEDLELAASPIELLLRRSQRASRAFEASRDGSDRLRRPSGELQQMKMPWDAPDAATGDADGVQQDKKSLQWPIWNVRAAPIVSCAMQKDLDDIASANAVDVEADRNLKGALAIYCGAGLDDNVEFYVDPRFQGNDRRLRGEDGWLDKAYVTTISHNAGNESDGTAVDLLVQSIHHFSSQPVLVASFGSFLPAALSPDRFPNLILVHARTSADRTTGLNGLDRLPAMMFTRVRTGLILDRRHVISANLDALLQRAAEEITSSSRFPILPVHRMSRDPESDDMRKHPDTASFVFSSSFAPQRTMRWGQAYPAWTAHSLPWLARWSAYLFTQDGSLPYAPAWLSEQGHWEVEELLNAALWESGAHKQWCSLEVHETRHLHAYLQHVGGNITQLLLELHAFKESSASLIDGDDAKNTGTLHAKAEVLAATGDSDAKFYPRGVPQIIAAIPSRDVEPTFHWLGAMWEHRHRMSTGSVPIVYQGRWFSSQKALRDFDENLKCLA